MSWTINARTLTGKLISVQVSNPESSCVLDLKKLISQKDESLPTYLQRLVIQAGGERKKLEDECKLSEAGVCDGITLPLISLQSFELYVQDMNGRKHVIVVPSSEPEMYYISSLTTLVQSETGLNLDEYVFQFHGRPIDAVKHGKKMTLKDWSIKAKSTLILMKMGLMLNITNPKVDVCFMVDCTGSMQSYIEAVKNSVQQLRDRLVQEYKGCDLRFCFVRYTDYDQPSSTRTTWINFTNSQESFRSFVSAIKAGGGGDSPEDIMGALKSTFTRLSWRSDCSKVLIHIADAPCHGTEYHSLDDSYPNGDPAGISHESMMAEVVRLDIQYWFGYIQKSYTDKMIGIFNDSLRRQSEQRLLIRQFDAIQPSEVSDAIHRSVSDSVLGTAAAKQAEVRKYTISASIPDWSSPSVIEIYGKKTPPPNIKELSDLQHAGSLLESPRFDVCFKIAPNPFAEGSESHVYHGYDVNNKRAIILKRHKWVAAKFHTLESYMKKLEVQTVATIYAREFNCDKSKGSPTTEVTFSPVDVVECNGNEYYLWEPVLSGKMEKFSNNSGIVRSSPHNDVLQAYSHFTWVKSGKSLVVCDLEGIVQGNRLILTDPAIHSRGPAGTCGETDAGYEGIQRFFSTHVCQETCKKMGLVSQKL